MRQFLPFLLLILFCPSLALSTNTTFVEGRELTLYGKKVFPIGIYDAGIGYSRAPQYWKQKLGDLFYENSPFNLYLNYQFGRMPDDIIRNHLIPFLRSHGAAYLHTTIAWHPDHKSWPRMPKCGDADTTSSYAACRGKSLSNIEGLLGFYVADEPKSDLFDRVKSQYHAFKKQGNLTFASFNHPPSFAKWAQTADILDLHRYPLRKVDPDPMRIIFDRVKHARQVAGNSKPIWTVLQAFEHSRWRFPLEHELRTMAFMAIVGGADGLLFWSYGSKSIRWIAKKDPAKARELWQRVRHVAQEIKTLESVLLAKTVNHMISYSNPNIGFIAKQLGKNITILSVNLSIEDISTTLTNGSSEQTIQYKSHEVRIIKLP